MITHQCARCIELADELRIARANNAQLCKDFDRRNELVEALEAKVADLDGALARLGEDWAKQHVALIEKRGNVARLEADKEVLVRNANQAFDAMQGQQERIAELEADRDTWKARAEFSFGERTNLERIKDGVMQQRDLERAGYLREFQFRIDAEDKCSKLEAELVNRVDTKPNIVSPARQQNLEATCLEFWGLVENQE